MPYLSASAVVIHYEEALRSIEMVVSQSKFSRILVESNIIVADTALNEKCIT